MVVWCGVVRRVGCRAFERLVGARLDSSFVENLECLEATRYMLDWTVIVDSVEFGKNRRPLGRLARGGIGRFSQSRDVESEDSGAAIRACLGSGGSEGERSFAERRVSSSRGGEFLESVWSTAIRVQV